MVGAVARLAEVRLATWAMGTRFELVARGLEPRELTAAAEAALETVTEAHTWLTRFESSSLLAHLRRVAPVSATVDTPTMALFLEARELTEATDRAFDPICRGTWGDIFLDPSAQTIGFARSDVSVDFGAIAKGHAIDLAIARLRQSGVAAGFVHGGTSSGAGFGGNGWKVALGDRPDAPVVILDDQAFAVSATRQPGDRDTAHLIDRRSGQPITERRRAAVVGPSGRRSDALATAITVAATRSKAVGPEYRTWLQSEDGPWRVLEE